MSKRYFIAKVYAVLKDKGIDTSCMSVDVAIAKYEELVGKSGKFKVETGERQVNKRPPLRKKYLKLPAQEYAAVCSAIVTSKANKIPERGGQFYNNSYYFYDYDKKTCLIRFTMIFNIEEDRDLIDYWEKKNDKR